MPEKFQKNGWSSKFSCEIVPEFQKKHYSQAGGDTSSNFWHK